MYNWVSHRSIFLNFFHDLLDFFDNPRYPHFYREQGLLSRDLYKVYGIRILVRVTGEAGKFSIVPLLLTIGSGIGLLAVVSKLFMFLCYHKFVKEITKDELNQVQGITLTESIAKKLVAPCYISSNFKQLERNWELVTLCFEWSTMQLQYNFHIQHRCD